MQATAGNLVSALVGWVQSRRSEQLVQQHLSETRENMKRTSEEMSKMRMQLEAAHLKSGGQSTAPVTLSPMQVPSQGVVLVQMPAAQVPMVPATAPVANPPSPEEPPAPAPTAPYSGYLQEYGQQTQEDVSVGCIPCTRAHLSTVAAALRRSENGDPTAVAAAREEMAALLEYDLTPAKLAATPARDREILAKYAGEIDSLSRSIAGPAPQITTASASLKEALRFARADGVEHPEAQLRIAHTEDLVNEAERVSFSPERLSKLPAKARKQVKALLPELRATRQDLINNVHSADELEAVTVRLAQIDQALNPSPAAATVREVAGRATALNTQFRADVVAALKAGGNAHDGSQK